MSIKILPRGLDRGTSKSLLDGNEKGEQGMGSEEQGFECCDFGIAGAASAGDIPGDGNRKRSMIGYDTSEDVIGHGKHK